MSKYTTEIRFVCENAMGLKEQGDYSDIPQAIQSGRKKIFTFDYELFDENYKSVIETKFLRHFYTREIGFETLALFKLKLEDKWTMKLPYYNKLWESALIEFNPMYDVDYWTDHKGDGTNDRTDNLTHTHGGTNKRTGTQSLDSNGESDRHEDLIDKYSDTPQGALNGVIDTDWLTNARQDENDIHTEYENHDVTTFDVTDTLNMTDRNTGTVGFITTDNYLRHVAGKMGTKSYSELLKEYRKTFINIDEMFINEMNDLFMLIY